MDKWFANGIKVQEKYANLFFCIRQSFEYRWVIFFRPEVGAFGSKKKTLLVVVTGVTIAFLAIVIIVAIVVATATKS